MLQEDRCSAKSPKTDSVAVPQAGHTTLDPALETSFGLENYDTDQISGMNRLILETDNWSIITQIMCEGCLNMKKC